MAIEKNIDAFLRMSWSGTKLVIGDGPELPRLKAQYPNAVYAGYQFGDALAQHLAAADVMVFPSLTDTFGLVNLEAMACGVPVAAYPVAGPIDVIEDGVTGALDQDLAAAAVRALTIDPQACRDRALRSGWDMSSREFELNLVPCHGQRVTRAVQVTAKRASAGLMEATRSTSASGTRSRAAEMVLFASNFLRHPHMLGSIVPSSRHLVNAVLAPIDWHRARVIVEYGPGVGTFTAEILRRMRHDARVDRHRDQPRIRAFHGQHLRRQPAAHRARLRRERAVHTPADRAAARQLHRVRNSAGQHAEEPAGRDRRGEP